MGSGEQWNRYGNLPIAVPLLPRPRLQQFEHGRFHNFVAVDGDWLRGIAGIVETANGDLWLNGLSGVFHIGRAELAEAIKNSTYQVKGEHLGARDGLPGVAEQLRPLGSTIEGSDRGLWLLRRVAWCGLIQIVQL
jgi:hypothetical protein